MPNTKRETISDKIQALEEYIELEGSEWGEMMGLLVQLYGYRDYCSEKLVKAMESDISTQLEAARENAEIIETKETFTRTVKTLEWY